MLRLSRTYKPKGHPREGLAYLNAAEMDFLRRMTDGKISRGPKGIPSFRMDDKDIEDIRRGPDSPGPNTGNNPGNLNAGGYNGGGGEKLGGNDRTPNSPGNNGPSNNTANNVPSRGNESGYNSPNNNTSSRGPSPGGGDTSNRRNESGFGSGPSGGSPTSNTTPAREPDFGGGVGPSSTASDFSWTNKNTGGIKGVGAGLSARQTPIGAGLSSVGAGVPVANVPQTPSARNFGAGVVPVARVPGDAALLGRMMQAESGIIKNPDGSVNTEAMAGVAQVVRNRMLEQNKSLKSVLSAPKQFSPWHDGSFAATPENPLATSIADGVLSGQLPSHVGGALNYGNLQTINNKPNYSSKKTKAGFNAMDPVKTYTSGLNPNFQHSFGTWGKPASEVLWGKDNVTTQVAGNPAISRPTMSGHLASLDSPMANPVNTSSAQQATLSPNAASVYSPQMQNDLYGSFQDALLSPDIQANPYGQGQDAMFSPDIQANPYSQQIDPQQAPEAQPNASPQLNPQRSGSPLRQAPQGLNALPVGPGAGLGALPPGAAINPLQSPQIGPMQSPELQSMEPSMDMLEMESPMVEGAPGKDQDRLPQQQPQAPQMQPPSGTYFKTTPPTVEATAPSMWDSLYKKGAETAEYVKENVLDPVKQTVDEHGGFAKAGTKARMAVDLLGLGRDRYAAATDPGGRFTHKQQQGNDGQQRGRTGKGDKPGDENKTINQLLAELQSSRDPRRRGEILKRLAQLDPDTVRYGLLMGA